MPLRKKLLCVILAAVCVAMLTSMDVSAEYVSPAFPMALSSRHIVNGHFINNQIFDKPPLNVLSMAAPCDNHFPSNTWNLSTSGKYNLDGSAQGSAELYTMYRFESDSGEINYTIYNNNNTTDIDVYYYKNGNLFMFHRHKLCTIAAGESQSGTISVDSNDYIVFSFIPPCNVTGTITE